MDATWILLLLFLSLSVALKILLSFTKTTTTTKKTSRLPPGPPFIPIIGNLTWRMGLYLNAEGTVRRLCAEFGPIATLHIGPHPSIFISDRSLAHQALVQSGAALADRLPAMPHDRILTGNNHIISSASYGPLWRVLRRNLNNPSRVKLAAHARESALRALLDNLRARDGGLVVLVDSLFYTMSCLMVHMCFGEELDEKDNREIQELQKDLFMRFREFYVFAFLPSITKLVFRKRWNRMLMIRKKQEELYIPLIRRARQRREHKQSFAHSYVDSLLGLELPEEEGGREMSEGELVSLCGEFVGGGTETTTVALEWILANLVKRQDIQAKLVGEMEGVVGRGAEGIREEELEKIPYLRAVILEGLRRHPPAHLVLPHAVAEEITVGGYVIPKNLSVNFQLAEIGLDEAVWEEPMEFRPERFMAGGSGEGVDLTGSKEIKMIPFGAGRRICPGLGLAMFHLEYFLANLVWGFEWKAVEGEEVDLTEKVELTIVMKNHLRARITRRRTK